MTETDRVALINAIATREGNARQLANRFGTTVDDLRLFVTHNREAITLAKEALVTDEEEDSRDVSPMQLAELWITNKYDRLERYQAVADHLCRLALIDGVYDPVVLRELRSYMMAAANELGQLLHRGSGEGNSGDSLSIDIGGVDMDTMR